MRTLDIGAGMEITAAIDAAIEESAEHGEACQFEFNGVTVVVCGDSDPGLIYREWDRGMRGYLANKPAVGPHPPPRLSGAAIASDAAIQADKDEVLAAFSAERGRQQAAALTTLQGALSVAGPIELAEPEKWRLCVDANQDGYGGRCVSFAEDWARMMQVRIANGETVAGCADELSRLADHDGITGFMYGCAVSMLAQCWRYGDELRRWHNKVTQIGTEGDAANEGGGVLNPAVLRLGNAMVARREGKR